MSWFSRLLCDLTCREVESRCRCNSAKTLSGSPQKPVVLYRAPDSIGDRKLYFVFDGSCPTRFMSESFARQLARGRTCLRWKLSSARCMTATRLSTYASYWKSHTKSPKVYKRSRWCAKTVTLPRNIRSFLWKTSCITSVAPFERSSQSWRKLQQRSTRTIAKQARRRSSLIFVNDCLGFPLPTLSI